MYFTLPHTIIMYVAMHNQNHYDDIRTEEIFLQI